MSIIQDGEGFVLAFPSLENVEMEQQLKDLQERYKVLFRMHAQMIYELHMQVNKSLFNCAGQVEKQIELELEEKKNPS